MRKLIASLVLVLPLATPPLAGGSQAGYCAVSSGNAWTWTIDSESKGVVTPFARVTLTRKWPQCSPNAAAALTPRFRDRKFWPHGLWYTSTALRRTMAEQLPGGPYWHVDLGNGVAAPWFIAPFDKDGRCTAPKTRASLISLAATGEFTDIFIFSHGWNNDWDTASARYHRFIDGYAKMRRDRGLAMPADYKPLLIGVFWPSTALVLPWEKAPKFAGADVDLTRHASGVDQETREVETLSAVLPEASRERFYALARKGDLLTDAEAAEFANLVLPIYNDARLAESDEGGPNAAPMTADDVLAAWSVTAKTAQPARKANAEGFYVVQEPAGGSHAPAAAGFLANLDPRNLVRLLTVYQMKDRAGVIGTRGVGPLLRDLLTSCSAKVHLVGHSYGAKVALSAVSASDISRKVNSLLLLEPAVNGWCFAPDVDGRGYPGGFAHVLDRVELPILTTFSKNDSPLTTHFHLAVRRNTDLGELKVAMTWKPQSPSKFGALGGFGPQGLSDAVCSFIALQPVGVRYAFAPGVKVIALNSDDGIAGHGDVEVPQTFWALYNQVASAHGL